MGHSEIIRYLWLIPVLPLAAAAAISVTGRSRRAFAATTAIGAMGLSFLYSLVAFASTMSHLGAGVGPERYVNFRWLQFGAEWLRLGWVLDPLSAIMLLMVSLVSLLVFIYSVGYMAKDGNFVRFFCFLSLFAAAMLGLVMSNSLLMLFMCWELVGVSSYLLIGFWFEKPSAQAAAKKAFITTRLGDLGLFIGMIWLSSQGGLLFYNHGQGCLEATALGHLAQTTVGLGLPLSQAIALLIFCGAVGKSGQIPLHVWLPDAMEGPTPVSALIHAATMVAAGVYLVARTYPLFSDGATTTMALTPSLTVVVWVGALTAFLAAAVAVAQDDIKRILAYSTISQLGYMMLGLGAGGVAVGMFHLLTHAFFKSLLFLGAGSVIHGCHEEQDIRKMGGLRRYMPVTFVTYAVAMLALCGFPLLFSGFWSKDEILHAAFEWRPSLWPFALGLAGAFLTAFYMTRQVSYVFFGSSRRHAVAAEGAAPESPAHESPAWMTWPMSVLAVFALGAGFLGTPVWPWVQRFLMSGASAVARVEAFTGTMVILMGISSLLVLAGIAVGAWYYGIHAIPAPEEKDILAVRWPTVFGWLRGKFYVDELYRATVIRWLEQFGRGVDWWDRTIWQGIVRGVSGVVLVLAWLDHFIDEWAINRGFNRGCEGVRGGGRWLSRLQSGQAQQYLRAVGLAVVFLVLIFVWLRWP